MAVHEQQAEKEIFPKELCDVLAEHLYCPVRFVLSKLETPVTAAAMMTAMVPPATTEYNRFFKEGVTPASATRGFARVAASPAVTATGSCSCVCWLLLLNCKSVKIRPHGWKGLRRSEYAARSVTYLATTGLFTRRAVILCVGTTAAGRAFFTPYARHGNFGKTRQLNLTHLLLR